MFQLFKQSQMLLRPVQPMLMDLQMMHISRTLRINRRVRKARAEKVQREQSFNRNDGNNSSLKFSFECFVEQEGPKAHDSGRVHGGWR